MTRPIRADIDLTAIRHNLLVSKNKAPNAKAYAVIKADAYGHGALQVARALEDNADGFALLRLEDALALKEAGIRRPLVLLEGAFDYEELAAMAEHGIAGAFHSPYQLDWLDRLPAGLRVKGWLKINSGMNRLGFRPEVLLDILNRLKAHPALRLSAIMTHFATADDPRGIGRQWPAFAKAAADSGLPVCAANSAALFRYPETHGTFVRPGVCLYGCSPFEGQTGSELGLKPAMTLSADIIAVQNLDSGESVGYGCGFTADKPTRLGVVACGYADGYPRVAPNGTPVTVDGAPSSLVGRVSMDMLTVDLSHLPQAGIGSRVELWGPHVPLETVARHAGTISYELMCAVAPRVPRAWQDN
ncbi:alanine racemase [Paludibacterium paludis]|uniref:Alanine racemase n=1 Tax=Paludibacterium paludis TaxID=1225769 RepID=A0A918NYX4_9NEIS|nr:alanine racemase [Paludibacterium paludis]GGY07993.1 alanine racemase [Paludibacterium paludis]